MVRRGAHTSRSRSFYSMSHTYQRHVYIFPHQRFSSSRRERIVMTIQDRALTVKAVVRRFFIGVVCGIRVAHGQAKMRKLNEKAKNASSVFFAVELLGTRMRTSVNRNDSRGIRPSVVGRVTSVRDRT